MKKVSLKFLALEISVLYVISFIAMYILVSATQPYIPTSDIFLFAIFMLLPVSFLHFYYGNPINDKIAINTIKKNAASHNFSNYDSFRGINTIILVDKLTGKLAYISNRNPFEFQVVSTRDITNAKSSYNKGPLGGTRYVYFEFYYQNKKHKIPTFVSRNMRNLKSESVLHAISIGDSFVESIRHANGENIN